MNEKLYPTLKDDIDQLSSRQFARLQDAIANDFLLVGGGTFEQETTKTGLKELHLVVEEYANIFTQGDQFVALIELAHRAHVYFRECERLGRIIIESKPEIPKIRRYWSGESYDLGVARTVREIITSKQRLETDDLGWLCPFSAEIAQLDGLRQALFAKVNDPIDGRVAFGLPEEVCRADDAWTRQDPAMRKLDVQRAHSTLSDACHNLQRAIWQLDENYAGNWHNFLRLRRAENALPDAESLLSKPLSQYAWDWRKNQYKHPLAQAVSELKVKIEVNEKARNPQTVREINYTFTPEHITELINATVDAYGVYANFLTNARTIVAHEQAKEDERATARAGQNSKRDEKRRELAHQPVIVPAKETDSGIKVDPVAMRRALQGRSGFVVILGTAVFIKTIKDWLTELERSASGKLARDWSTMADAYQVWFSNATGLTNQPITAVAHIKSSLSYGTMKVQATFKPQEVPGKELEFVNIVQFDGVDK